MDNRLKLWCQWGIICYLHKTVFFKDHRWCFLKLHCNWKNLLNPMTLNRSWKLIFIMITTILNHKAPLKCQVVSLSTVKCKKKPLHICSIFNIKHLIFLLLFSNDFATWQNVCHWRQWQDVTESWVRKWIGLWYEVICLNLIMGYFSHKARVRVFFLLKKI